MSFELAKLALRLQKTSAPTVHVLVPKFLLAHTLAQIVRERGEPAAVNKELFRLGILLGSLAVTKLASPASLRRFWPPKADAVRVAKFVKLLGGAAWWTLAGHIPSVKADAVDRRGLVWAEVREAPRRDAFYKIAAPQGVNVLFLMAGAYEGVVQEAFRAMNVEGEWHSFWRPLGGEGVCGFCAHRSVPAAEVIEAAEARREDFFKTVSWSDSAVYLEELLGARVAQP